MTDGGHPKSEFFNNPHNVSFAFRAFDQSIFLNPFLNEHLISDDINIVIRDGFGSTTTSKMATADANRKCHYVSLDAGHLAAVTICGHLDDTIVSPNERKKRRWVY